MKKTSTIDDLLSTLTESISTEELLAADIISNISNAIAKRRLSMELSQKDLAAKIGKTQSAISKWENGDMNFSVELLAEIAVKLNMDLNVELKSHPMIQSNGQYRAVSSKIINFKNIGGGYSADKFEELKEM